MSRPREDKVDHGDKHGVCIYARVLDITMVKMDGQFAGESFIHKFGRGTIIRGLPRGTVIRFPDGTKEKLKKRAAMIQHKDDAKDMWEERDV